MELQEKLWLATKAFDKGWSYEDLEYTDDFRILAQGKDDAKDLQEEIWDYVIEIGELGTIGFIEKYKEYRTQLFF